MNRLSSTIAAIGIAAALQASMHVSVGRESPRFIAQSAAARACNEPVIVIKLSAMAHSYNFRVRCESSTVQRTASHRDGFVIIVCVCTSARSNETRNNNIKGK